MNIQKIRNIIFGIIIIQFILTILLFSSLQDMLLLPVNIIEHILGVIYFILIGYMLYLGIIKKEFKALKKTLLNIFLWILFCILVFFISQDYFYTIMTPHPLFHDTYFI